MENYLVFLGTGGGRSVLYAQARATGGIYVSLDDLRFVIDPGPGSLVWFRKLKLKEPHGILLSHLHIDHSNDVNVYLDGMKDPFLVAERHCIEPNDFYPVVSRYHQEKVKNLYKVSPGDEVNLPNDIKVYVTKADHYVPTVGFKIVGSRTIGYPSDGPYFSGEEKPFENCDVLILHTLAPHGEKPMPKKHMTIDGAIEFINNLKNKPKLVILSHFSFWILRANVNVQAKIVEKATGVRTIPAEDFMRIDLDSLKEETKGLEDFIR